MFFKNFVEETDNLVAFFLPLSLLLFCFNYEQNIREFALPNRQQSTKTDPSWFVSIQNSGHPFFLSSSHVSVYQLGPSRSLSPPLIARRSLVKNCRWKWWVPDPFSWSHSSLESPKACVPLPKNGVLQKRNYKIMSAMEWPRKNDHEWLFRNGVSSNTPLR